MVFKDIEHVNQESYFVALVKGSSEKSQRGNSSPSSEQDSKTGGLDGFRARLQEKGISKAASDLISKSRRPNCNANFDDIAKRVIRVFPFGIIKLSLLCLVSYLCSMY